jgi:stage II sporulation protein R
MKRKTLVFFISMFICLNVFIFTGCALNTSSINKDVVRIHIRANSNNCDDQDVKLKVRDNVVDYITPIIADCESSDDVKLILNNNLKNIEKIANDTLAKNGFLYKSSAVIDNEYFPSRMYGDKTFPADYYDALILRLGEGVGDNWWCVAYPPLCFVGYDNDSESIEYRSKIVELIKKYFGE